MKQIERILRLMLISTQLNMRIGFAASLPKTTILACTRERRFLKASATAFAITTTICARAMPVYYMTKEGFWQDACFRIILRTLLVNTAFGF